MTAEMLRLRIEFRNSIKKSKDKLLHRLSLNAFTCAGLNGDPKYPNLLKMAQNLEQQSFAVPQIL